MIPIENNSWDYVQRLIEREINSAFKLRMNDKDRNEALEKRVETLENEHQYPLFFLRLLEREIETLEKEVDNCGKNHKDLIENLRIFMVDTDEDEGKELYFPFHRRKESDGI